MNINNPTTFSAPDLTLSTSNSSGTAGALRADDTILVYDTTLPDAIAYGQSGNTGSSTTASRRDHSHAMAAGSPAASKAEMEARSSTTVFDTPGRTQYHPGVAKAWCMVSAAGELNSPSYNIDNVAATATGNRLVTFTTAFSTSSFNVHGLSDQVGTMIYAERTNASSCRFYTGDNASTPSNSDRYAGLGFYGAQ